jgi:hypothetical protein
MTGQSARAENDRGNKRTEESNPKHAAADLQKPYPESRTG